MQPAEVTCTPLRRGEDVVGTLWISDYAVAEGEQVREIRRLGDRLRRLAGVAADLATADSIDAVTEIVIDHAADAVGATVASLCLKLDDETLLLAGLRGGLAGAATRWAKFPIDAPTPAGDEAVLTETADGVELGLSVCYDLRFPELYRLLARRRRPHPHGPRGVHARRRRATTGSRSCAPARSRTRRSSIAANQIGEHPPGQRSGGRLDDRRPVGDRARAGAGHGGHITADLDLDAPGRHPRRLPSLANRRPRGLPPRGRRDARLMATARSPAARPTSAA